MLKTFFLALLFCTYWRFFNNLFLEDSFDWPHWISIFLGEGFRTVFGYKKRKCSYSSKFPYKIFWANICLGLHSRFEKINSTKISQKSLILWFRKLLSWIEVYSYWLCDTETYSKPCKTSMIKGFVKIINGV